MLKIENCERYIWVKTEKSNRYKVYLFHCKKCGNIIKSRKSYLKKHTGHCIKCSSKLTIKYAQKANKKKSFEARYNNFISRVKNDFIKTDVKYEDYLKFTKINNCHYCNTRIPWEPYGENTPGFFLDRMDNNKFHTLDNLVVCCSICNFTKRDEFSYNEFLLIGKVLKKIRINRGKNNGKST